MAGLPQLLQHPPTQENEISQAPGQMPLRTLPREMDEGRICRIVKATTNLSHLFCHLKKQTHVAPTVTANRMATVVKYAAFFLTLSPRKSLSTVDAKKVIPGVSMAGAAGRGWERGRAEGGRKGKMPVRARPFSQGGQGGGGGGKGTAEWIWTGRTGR